MIDFKKKYNLGEVLRNNERNYAVGSDIVLDTKRQTSITKRFELKQGLI